MLQLPSSETLVYRSDIYYFELGDRLLITAFAGSDIRGKIFDAQEEVKFSFSSAGQFQKFIYSFPETSRYIIELEIYRNGQGTGAAIRCFAQIH